MYMVRAYNYWVVSPDMDHIVHIRQATHMKTYEDVLMALVKFQEDLVLYLDGKSWVIEFFGKFLFMGG